MDTQELINKIQLEFNVSEFTACLFLEANLYLTKMLESGEYKLKETTKEKQKKKEENKKLSFEEQMARFNITAVAKT